MRPVCDVDESRHALVFRALIASRTSTPMYCLTSMFISVLKSSCNVRRGPS